MKLNLRGHEDRYAIEQSLLAFFPEERPVYEGEDGDSHAEVTLHEGNVYATGVTTLTYGGKTARGEARVRTAGVSDAYERERLRQRALKLSFFRAARVVTGVTPSWGALTGIRPAKLVRTMLEDGMTPDATLYLAIDHREALRRRLSASEPDRLELEAKLREAQDRAAMLEAETGRLQSLNEQLKKNENVPGTEELRILYDKSRLYDDIKNNVSRLVSDARRKAAELIYEAEQSSRQIMADGVASLTEMQRRIRAMQEEVREIQDRYESATGNVNTLFQNISDTLSITDNHLISMLGENGADAEKPAEPDWPL